MAYNNDVSFDNLKRIYLFTYINTLEGTNLGWEIIKNTDPDYKTMYKTLQSKYKTRFQDTQNQKFIKDVEAVEAAEVEAVAEKAAEAVMENLNDDAAKVAKANLEEAKAKVNEAMTSLANVGVVKERVRMLTEAAAAAAEAAKGGGRKSRRKRPTKRRKNHKKRTHRRRR